MGRAVLSLQRDEQGSRTKKPSERQESESPVGHEGSQRQGEEFYDPARKDSILRRKQTRLELWEERSKTQL